MEQTEIDHSEYPPNMSFIPLITLEQLQFVLDLS